MESVIPWTRGHRSKLSSLSVAAQCSSARIHSALEVDGEDNPTSSKLCLSHS